MAENTRGRVYAILLYPDDKTHVEALEKIKKMYSYAYILHNKDVDENGEIKKEHIHVVAKVGNNPRWRSAIAEELEIKENYLEVCNLEKMLRYLIHYDNPEKYLYNIEEVKGDLKKKG